MKNGQPAHGEFRLFQTGLITEIQNAYSYPFYFAYGRLLYNKESFDFIQELQEMFDETLLHEDIQEIVDYFSYNPLKRANKFYEVFEDKLSYIFGYVKNYYYLCGVKHLNRKSSF